MSVFFSAVNLEKVLLEQWFGANQSYMLGVVVHFGGCGRETDSLRLAWAT